MKEYIVAVPEHLAGDLFNGDQELIRCKKCKYFSGDNHYCDFDMYVTSDDFCSKGEEKNDHQG